MNRNNDERAVKIAVMILTVFLSGVLLLLGYFVILQQTEKFALSQVKEITTENKEINVIPMSSRMTFSTSLAEVEATAAETSVTVKATITPNTAANKEVDWTVDWVNGASAWASGKVASEYLSVTPAEDGALTATVVCQKAFGEQIAIKVTSRENAEKTATCIVDYLGRITFSGVEVTYQDYPESNISVRGQDEGEILELTLPEVENVYDLLTTNAYEYAIKEYHYGTYTKEDEVVSQKLEIQPSAEFLEAYGSLSGLHEFFWPSSTGWYEIEEFNYLDFLQVFCGYSNLIDYEAGTLNTDGYERVLTAFSQTKVYDFTLRITTTCKSGAETQYEVLFHISDKTPGLAVEEVTVENENLVV